MMKIFCDKCEQEITDPAEISTVFEDGEAKHYHKTDCFTSARNVLLNTGTGSPTMP